MLPQLQMGRSDLRTLLSLIHEVVIRLNEVARGTNSFMLLMSSWSETETPKFPVPLSLPLHLYEEVATRGRAGSEGWMGYAEKPFPVNVQCL